MKLGVFGSISTLKATDADLRLKIVIADGTGGRICRLVARVISLQQKPETAQTDLFLGGC
jgi:hypothetical protein